MKKSKPLVQHEQISKLFEKDAQFKLVLDHAIFFVTCVAIALRDKLHVGSSMQDALSATCLATILGFQRVNKIGNSKSPTVQYFTLILCTFAENKTEEERGHRSVENG